MKQEIKIKDLCNIVKIAVNEVYLFDSYLIDNEVNERTVQHCLAKYLDQIVKLFYEYSYFIDIEYNRNLGWYKDLTGDGKPNYPDIIIHNRGDNDHNLIYIEMKINTSKDYNDQLKLKYATGHESDYSFQLGVYINFMKDKASYKWFVRGDEIEV